jgi:hypothetical protein
MRVLRASKPDIRASAGRAGTATELSERFDGLTAYTRAPATGVWKKHTGRTSRDDIIIYEVMCPRLQRKWWKAKRSELERIFHQDTVLIRSHAITAQVLGRVNAVAGSEVR